MKISLVKPLLPLFKGRPCCPPPLSFCPTSPGPTVLALPTIFCNLALSMHPSLTLCLWLSPSHSCKARFVGKRDFVVSGRCQVGFCLVSREVVLRFGFKKFFQKLSKSRGLQESIDYFDVSNSISLDCKNHASLRKGDHSELAPRWRISSSLAETGLL